MISAIYILLANRPSIFYTFNILLVYSYNLLGLFNDIFVDGFKFGDIGNNDTKSL